MFYKHSELISNSFVSLVLNLSKISHAFNQKQKALEAQVTPGVQSKALFHEQNKPN